MKKVLSIMLVFVIFFSFSACSNEKSNLSDNNTSISSGIQSENQSSNYTNTESTQNNTDENSSNTEASNKTEVSSNTETSSNASSNPTTSESKPVTSSKPNPTVSKTKIWLPTEKKYNDGSGERYKYDSDGKLIEMISFNENEEVEKIIFEYGNNNGVSKMTCYLRGKFNGVINCECNNNGNIIKLKLENADELDNLHVEYNANGKIIRSVSYNGNVIGEEHTLVYDSKGNVISHTSKYENQEPKTNTYEYKFDNKGRIIETKSDDATTKYNYDNNDNVIYTDAYFDGQERACKYSYASFEVPVNRVNWYKNQLDIFSVC